MDSTNLTLGIHTPEMLDDAMKRFMEDHAVLLNERINWLFEYGPACDEALRSHKPQVHSRCQKLESLIKRAEAQMRQRVLLAGAAKGAIHLQKGMDTGPVGFPQLRARLPEATQLILSLVGNADQEVAPNDQVTLAVFAEFYQSISLWKDFLS